MAKLVYAMNVSLDGYADHDAFAPGPATFRYWIDHVRRLAGSIYGRRTYELMRYWDDDRPEWEAPERAFADAWRQHPKWVASRTLATVGPNATLLAGDVAADVRRLRDERDGEIAVAGPEIAAWLGDLGLVDEYRLCLHPFVVGRGKRYFAGARAPLRLVQSEPIEDEAIMLSYAPA